MSPHWGVRALLGEGVSRSGVGRGSGRPGGAAPHRGMGEYRGHREMPKVFWTRRQESRVRMRGVRVETEQEEPGVTSIKK